MSSVTVTKLVPGVVNWVGFALSPFVHRKEYGGVPPEATAVAVTEVLVQVNNP